MSDVVMPRLSDTMEEGELAKWLKNEGDVIAKGDILAEIETDKATMDLEAFEAGVLEKQLVAAGTIVPIGTPVAVIGDGSGTAGSSAKGAPSTSAQASAKASAKDAQAKDAVAPAASATDAVEAISTAAPQESAPASDAESAQDAAHQQAASAPASSAPRMSPLARKMAKDSGLDPASITGTGPQGRVVRADVEAAIARGPASGTSSATSTSRPLAGASASGVLALETGTDEVVAVNRIRKVAAKRLTESQAIPHFFLTSVVNMEKLLAFRKDVNERFESRGVKVSVNDLFVRAAAVALREHPEANSSWGDDELIRRGNVNIGIAVATDAGLLVPVIRNADRKDLAAISLEAVELAGKARDGKLSPDEMSGGTFSVSNLGMFGIDQFTAMINPPEAAILAVGATSPVPTLRDGHLVEVPKLKLTLTVDHRVMDGAVAAGFLRDLVEILEKPLRLIL